MFLLNLLKKYLMNDLDTQNKKMMMLLELRKMGIIDNKLLNIIGNFDREIFLPNRFKGLSKENISLQIFEGVETTTLTDIAKMIFLVLQNNKNTNVVLEIGTGSGMLTAILSKIYGRVYSVEINQKAYKFSTLIFVEGTLMDRSFNIFVDAVCIFFLSKNFNPMTFLWISLPKKRFPATSIELHKDKS